MGQRQATLRIDAAVGKFTEKITAHDSKLLSRRQSHNVSVVVMRWYHFLTHDHANDDVWKVNTRGGGEERCSPNPWIDLNKTKS